MKVVNTVQLKKLADHARNLNLNRLLDGRIEEKLDLTGYHVLSQPMIHNDDCVRCLIVLIKLKNKPDPMECVMDFDIEDFNLIPEHKE